MIDQLFVFCQYCLVKTCDVIIQDGEWKIPIAVEDGCWSCPNCGDKDSTFHIYYKFVSGVITVVMTLVARVSDGQIFAIIDSLIGVPGETQKDRWLREKKEAFEEELRAWREYPAEMQAEKRRLERLQMTKECSRCGRIFQIDHVFCYYCGCCFECEEEWLPRTSDACAEHWTCHASQDSSDDDDD